LFRPAGVLDGYAGWESHALEVEIADGVRIRLGALGDIIASKRAADRPKDRAALPYLESLLDETKQ
jgi:hypothetical protein